MGDACVSRAGIDGSGGVSPPKCFALVKSRQYEMSPCLHGVPSEGAIVVVHVEPAAHKYIRRPALVHLYIARLQALQVRRPQELPEKVRIVDLIRVKPDRDNSVRGDLTLVAPRVNTRYEGAQLPPLCRRSQCQQH